MLGSITVNIVKRLYNTNDRYVFTRLCEFLNLLLLIMIVAVVGLVYAIITHAETLYICIAVLVLCFGVFFVIWLKGKKLPPEKINKR